MQRRIIQEVSVEGAQRRKPSNRIVYSIKVAWSDGTINIVYRRHSEVLQLERNLLETFTSNKRQRVIPSLQGRIKLLPASVYKKVDRIRDFILNLISLPDHISKCQLVISFFTPKPEDLESVQPKASRKNPKRKTAGSNSKTVKCIGEPILLEQYVALKNYQKQYHNDISLTKGYTVDVIEKHESGWWNVDCEGDIGWVPASFIKPLNDDGDSIVTERFIAGKEEIYMTTNSYKAKKEDEISFDIGVNLHVKEKTLDGWWRVVYMNEEGWAPAVFLKKVGVATGNSPAILKPLPMMGMQLRDKAKGSEEIPKTTVQDEECSLLTPVWNTHRRHSASEVDVCQLKTERQQRQLPSLRSTWGSTGDLRDVLPNFRRSISEFDLPLTDRSEEEPITPETLRQTCSFSFPEDMNKISGKKNMMEKLSSIDVQTSVNIAPLPSSRLRSFSDSPDLSNFIARKIKPSASKRLLNQREFRRSLSSICGTPSASDAEYSPLQARTRDSSLRNVENREGNKSLHFIMNPVDQNKEIEEDENEKGKHQPHRKAKEDVMYQRRVGVVAATLQGSLKDLPAMEKEMRDEMRVFEGVMNAEVQNEGCSLLTSSPTRKRHSSSELGVPPVKTNGQSSTLLSHRSCCSSESLRSPNRDLRDSLPDRGLSISELDLRFAIRKEEERIAGETKKRNRSISLSSNLKEFFSKTNLTESVSSKYARASKKKFSLPLLGLKPFSQTLDSSRPLVSKLKHTGKENSLSRRESRASFASNCITPLVSDTEHSPRLSMKLRSIPANVQALGGNEYRANNFNQLGQTIKISGEEDDQFATEDGWMPNACDGNKCVTKHQKREENKQQEQQAGSDKVCHYKGSVHHGQNEQERDSTTEKHGIDQSETKKEGFDNRVFAAGEQENSLSIISRGTDTDNYFVFCTYQASGDGEMTVYEGDEVEVLTKAPNGWWMVCIDDDVGWVPSNFLVAKGRQEDEVNQDSLKLADHQENGRLSSDDYDGDYQNDEKEHEEAEEHGIDDTEENEYFDMAPWVDEGQSEIWAQPNPRPRQQLGNLHNNRHHYPGTLRPSCNKCWFDPADIIRQSSGTWSNSSTGTNSSNSDKPPRYERSRRNKSGKKGFINDNHGYSTGIGYNMVHRIKAPSSSKEAVCRQQKWCRRFEATNGCRYLSKEHHSLLTESRRMPPAKRKSQVSYDSGFPEDYRTNAVRRIVRKSLVPDTIANHHNRLSRPTSCRRYHSQFEDGYVLRNPPQYRPGRASLHVCHEDNSSNSEGHQRMKNHSVCKGSFCDDFAVYSYPWRPRRRANRSKPPKHSIQKDALYSRYPSGSHSLRLAYRAIASYRASTDDTIDLYEGDKVQVIRKSKGGWWFVKINDEEGWAPSNYLEPITCYDE